MPTAAAATVHAPDRRPSVVRRFVWNGRPCRVTLARDPLSGRRHGVLSREDFLRGHGLDHRLSLGALDPDGFVTDHAPDAYLRDVLVNALLLGLIWPEPMPEIVR